MLEFRSPISRRSFLRVGGLAAGGLSLAELLRLKAHGAIDARRSNKAKRFSLGKSSAAAARATSYAKGWPKPDAFASSSRRRRFISSVRSTASPIRARWR